MGGVECVTNNRWMGWRRCFTSHPNNDVRRTLWVDRCVENWLGALVGVVVSPHAQVNLGLKQEWLNGCPQQPAYRLVARVVPIPVAVDVPSGRNVMLRRYQYTAHNCQY